jgi:hypothetical protein
MNGLDAIQIYGAAFTRTPNRSLALGRPSRSVTGTARRLWQTSLHPQRQLYHLTVAVSPSIQKHQLDKQKQIRWSSLSTSRGYTSSRMPHE